MMVKITTAPPSSLLSLSLSNDLSLILELQLICWFRISVLENGLDLADIRLKGWTTGDQSLERIVSKGSEPIVVEELLEAVQLTEATMDANIKQSLQEEGTLHREGVTTVSMSGDWDDKRLRERVVICSGEESCVSRGGGWGGRRGRSLTNDGILIWVGKVLLNGLWGDGGIHLIEVRVIASEPTLFRPFPFSSSSFMQSSNSAMIESDPIPDQMIFIVDIVDELSVTMTLKGTRVEQHFIS
jgi:hypothetical protein